MPDLFPWDDVLTEDPAPAAAPDLSEEEAATVARFEAAPDALADDDRAAEILVTLNTLPPGPKPPADDADVEAWRAYFEEIDPPRFVSMNGRRMNRSQIRTALGLAHPGVTPDEFPREEWADEYGTEETVTIPIAPGNGRRHPYVGEGADGARRSAQIDREEIDGLDRDDPRVADLVESAARWDAQAADLDAEEVVEAKIPAGEIAVPGASFDVDTILDRLAGDPGDLASTVAEIRDTAVEAVRRRADARAQTRPAKVSNPTDLRREFLGAADDADVLAGFAGAFSTAAAEAKVLAGDLLDELPKRGGKARASATFGDGSGFDVKIARSKRTETAVDADEVVEVVVASLLATAKDRGKVELGTMPAKTYAEGVRDGVARFRDLLSASPGFKVTALDAFLREVEALDEDALAKRLAAAYGRVEKGEPTVKIDRTPAKPADTDTPKEN